jgi:hypothetical protein
MQVPVDRIPPHSVCSAAFRAVGRRSDAVVQDPDYRDRHVLSPAVVRLLRSEKHAPLHGNEHGFPRSLAKTWLSWWPTRRLRLPPHASNGAARGIAQRMERERETDGAVTRDPCKRALPPRLLYDLVELHVHR